MVTLKNLSSFLMVILQHALWFPLLDCLVCYFKLEQNKFTRKDKDLNLQKQEGKGNASILKEIK